MMRPGRLLLVLLVAAAAPIALAQQEGSGTSWLPGVTHMDGVMAERGAWDLMLHYNLFAGVIFEEPEIGSTEGFTTNWLMGMARYETKGTLMLRGMLSLEAPFLGEEGYPLLMQTGETAHGQLLVDRQHPHDLVMEMAAKYDLPIDGGTSFEAYVAPVGEPALGPPAFMHRPSAMTNPVAPLGHHWEDSTHIAFGVITAGFFWSGVKVEGSVFNGREPDENRYDFDFDPLDSYSARVSFDPSENWSFQISAGHLEEPEALEPETDVRRITASAIRARGKWNSTLAWGWNDPSDHGTSSAVLIETSWSNEPHAAFGRGEYVQKTAHDFGLPGEERLPVGEIAAGYSYRVAEIAGMALSAGGEGMIGFVGETLSNRYDTSRPLSALVFLQLRPATKHDHAHMHH